MNFEPNGKAFIRKDPADGYNKFAIVNFEPIGKPSR